MKNKTFILLSLFITLEMAIGQSSKDAAVEMCGEPPGLVSSFFTDLEKIRTKCVNDYYESKEKERRAEAAGLADALQKMKDELKKVAHKVNYNMVECKGPTQAESSRTKRCQEIVQAQNALIKRIDVLNGWEKKISIIPRAKIQNKDLMIPCPSENELNQMQMARYFNKNVHQIWTKCKIEQF